jgi:hypothetical protein
MFLQGFTFFLWLLANNKTLTRDNLAKRRNVEDKSCLLCSELESTYHMFYDCCVARCMWNIVSEINGIFIHPDFESMTKMWVSAKKFRCINVCTSTVLWSFWKM